MRSGNILVLTGFSLLLVAASTYLRNTAAEPSALTKSPTIKIGALLCLSGICAEWGNQALRGASLAIKEINAAGGVRGKRIELVVEDSQEEQPALALKAFHHLRENKSIDIFLGPTWTPAGLAIAPLAKNDPNFLMISPSLGVREFNESHDNLFNVWPHDEGIASSLARYAWQRGLRRVGIMGATQQWSQTQAEAFLSQFQELGGDIVGREEPNPTEMSLHAEATRLLRTNPEAIIFTCLGDQEGAAARELRRLGFRGQFFSVLIDDTTISASAGTLDGVIFGRYPEARSWFAEKYQLAFNEKAGVASDTAYDAVQLLAIALASQENPTITQISQALFAIKNFSGASGDITFDKYGGVPREPNLLKLAGTAFVKLE